MLFYDLPNLYGILKHEIPNYKRLPTVIDVPGFKSPSVSTPLDIGERTSISILTVGAIFVSRLSIKLVLYP